MFTQAASAVFYCSPAAPYRWYCGGWKGAEVAETDFGMKGFAASDDDIILVEADSCAFDAKTFDSSSLMPMLNAYGAVEAQFYEFLLFCLPD